MSTNLSIEVASHNFLNRGFIEKIETWVSSSPQRKHKLKHEGKTFKINVGDIVMIKG